MICQHWEYNKYCAVVGRLDKAGRQAIVLLCSQSLGNILVSSGREGRWLLMAQIIRGSFSNLGLTDFTGRIQSGSSVVLV